LTRLISKSTFHLKGSGWYVTDYAGKSQSSSDASKKSEGSAKKDKKSETTSAE
jgi:predicted nucleic acid-binding Zn ribbon protein